MRDHDERALVTHEEIAQPVHGLEVEVVRRFVEEQAFGIAEERLCEQHPHFLAALQFSHLPIVQFIRNVQALKENRGVRLRFVTVFLADNALEFAEAHAFGVGHFRALVVQLLALLQRFPQALVAHDHGVADAELVVRVLILLEHAELVWPNDQAFLRRGFAREQLHERRFPGAVRPGQAVPPPGGKRRRDVLEEDLVAEAHGDVLNADHNL